MLFSVRVVRAIVAAAASFRPAPLPCCLPHCCNGGGREKYAWNIAVVSSTTNATGVIWRVADIFYNVSGKGTSGFCRKAGKLKVLLLIRGCVCIAEGLSMLRLKREAEGFAAVAVCWQWRGTLGNVVLWCFIRCCQPVAEWHRVISYS